jgi:hypothetical protein
MNRLEIFQEVYGKDYMFTETELSRLHQVAELIVKEGDRAMKEITDEEYDLFKKLTKIWFHTQPDKTGSFFICGEGGEHDEHGLPELILVCPQMGANITAVYKRDLVGSSGQ